MNSAWSEDSGSEAEGRDLSLSDKSTNVAISARRREVSFTPYPGAWVPGTREEVPDRGGSLELEANVRQR